MKKLHYNPTKIKRVPTEAGESIEEQLRRLYANKQPIPQDVPPMYTDAKDGVVPDTDIRHDRFDTAIDAADKFAASDTARSAERLQYEPQEQQDAQDQKEPKNAE